MSSKLCHIDLMRGFYNVIWETNSKKGEEIISSNNVSDKLSNLSGFNYPGDNSIT